MKTTREAIVELKDIRKSYGEVQILKGITLDLYKGEWTNIMGPSGSGKTTLLNIMSCLDKATEGSLKINGVEISGMSKQQLAHFRRETVGLIFQQYHLVPYLTALENVMLAQHYHSVVDEEEAAEALKKVGLGHRLNNIPGRMSGGEQQRVAIARALINKPEILLADEPTGNLDQANSELILDIFRNLRQEGHSIIMVTHSTEIGTLGDRLIQLQDGKITSQDNRQTTAAS
ncbi:MAG: macrolide exporter transport ATPase [Firmicutes bacterium]|nr:macrolide exporter transport ATPase [Bacillota bacterium]